MKLGDIFISTSLSSGSSINPQVRPEGDVAAGASQKFSSDLQAYKQSRQEAVITSARAEEEKAQQDNLIFKLNQNLERSQLDLVEQLTKIDLLHQEETAQIDANVYLSEQTTIAESQFKDFIQQAAQNPDTIVPAVHNYVNKQLTELRKKAPNEQALLKLESWAAEYKGKTLGNAIQLRKDINLQRNISSVDKTTNTLAADIYAGKVSLDDGFKKLEINKANLQQLGIKDEALNKRLTAYSSQIVNSKINSLLNNLNDNPTTAINNLAEARALVTAHSDLFPNVDKKFDEIQKVEDKFNKFVDERNAELVAQNKLSLNELTRFDSEKDRERAGRILNQVLPQQFSINENNLVGSISNIQSVLNVSGDVPIPQVQEYIAQALQSNNPYATYAISQAVLNNEKKANVIGQLSEKQVGIINLIDVLARHETDIPGAIEKVKQLTDPTNQVVNQRATELDYYYNKAQKLYSGYDDQSSIFHSVDEIETKAEYNRVFPIMYKLTGNEKAASQAANALVTKDRQTSKVNANMVYNEPGTGERKVMGESIEKFAPDLLWGEAFQDAALAEVNKQITSVLGEGFDPSTRLFKLAEGVQYPIAVKAIPFATESAILNNRPIPYQLIDGTPFGSQKKLGTIYMSNKPTAGALENKRKPFKIPKSAYLFPVAPGYAGAELGFTLAGDK